MTRWTLAGVMVLVAVGAGLDVGSATAEAASVSPFAGTYVGADPRGFSSSWTVTISNSGRITAFSVGRRGSWREISGKVSASGRYSFTVTKSARRSAGETITSSYKSAGKMALDADGNIVGAEAGGGSFSWLRQ